MLPKYLGGSNGKWRVEKNRGRRHFAAFHQINEVGDQFLSAFHCKGRNEEGAPGNGRVTNLGGQALASRLGRCWRAIDMP